MQIFLKLWRDQRGAAMSAELVLIATLVVVGVIVGLTSYRDAFVQELGDSAWAVGSLDQSYGFTTVLPPQPLTFGQIDPPAAGAGDPWVSVTVTVADSSFTDLNDDCDVAVEGAGTQTAGQAPACMVIDAVGSGESAPPLPFSP